MTTLALYSNFNNYLVLSDETILLWENNGKYYVQGTPWHGNEKVIIGSSKICELKKIYILEKDKYDQALILKNNFINKSFLCNQWLNTAQYNLDSFIKKISFLNNLTKDIKIYKLYFTKSNKFIDIINSEE